MKSCDGSHTCTATLHKHGCFSDRPCLHSEGTDEIIVNMDNRRFITVGEAAEGMAQAIARKFSELSGPIMADPKRAENVRLHQVEAELEVLQEVVGELMIQVERLQDLWKQKNG